MSKKKWLTAEELRGTCRALPRSSSLWTWWWCRASGPSCPTRLRALPLIGESKSWVWSCGFALLWEAIDWLNEWIWNKQTSKKRRCGALDSCVYVRELAREFEALKLFDPTMCLFVSADLIVQCVLASSSGVIECGHCREMIWCSFLIWWCSFTVGILFFLENNWWKYFSK